VADFDTSFFDLQSEGDDYQDNPYDYADEKHPLRSGASAPRYPPVSALGKIIHNRTLMTRNRSFFVAIFNCYQKRTKMESRRMITSTAKM
jgi:hypothetical protein